MIIAKARRAMPELNASSMADIAFLLLVFFLVTTVIGTEKGITVKLPPFEFEEPPYVPARNVLNVWINYDDELLVEGKPFKIERLREMAMRFILNPNEDPDLAISPKNAIISLQNDRSTSYNTYLSVYNELKAAYNELWDEAAQRQFGVRYEKLPRSKQAAIRNQFPLVISEGESVDYKVGIGF
ncbi:MAG: biopolymer transporter ExbD [Saprospiraceae bacterium]